MENQNEKIKKLQQEIELQQQIQQLEALVKQYLTKEAIQRYGNIKAAHPETAVQLIAIIAQAIQSGQIKEKIDDETLKDILINLQKPKREFKIHKR